MGKTRFRGHGQPTTQARPRQRGLLPVFWGIAGISAPREQVPDMKDLRTNFNVGYLGKSAAAVLDVVVVCISLFLLHLDTYRCGQ